MTEIKTRGPAYRLGQRPLMVIAMPAGEPLPPSWRMWLSSLMWRGQEWQIWRTCARQPDLPLGAVIVPREGWQVTDAEREAFRAQLSERIALWGGTLWESPAEEDLAIRRDRSDPDLLPWIFDAPVDLDFHRAADAGGMGMQSEHLFCGVRLLGGRWTYHIGLGSHMRLIGVCDSEAEALVMAMACLMASWLARLERIQTARGGDLGWGVPVVAPQEGICTE